jgi:RNA 2',3'-cyclic 3'-phosphodiesterase
MRLFVALDLPDDVRHALGEFIARLKPRYRDARWVRPEGMHVTLKFIGHAIRTGDTKGLEDVRAALATIHSQRPVEMHFRGAGFFPDSARPRVIWCGVEASQNLGQLATDIDRVLEPLGISREDRAFVPHLTLGRFQVSRAGKAHRSREESGQRMKSEVQEMAEEDFGSSHETEFHLFESIMKPTGSEYRKLETYPLVRGAE